MNHFNPVFFGFVLFSLDYVQSSGEPFKFSYTAISEKRGDSRNRIIQPLCGYREALRVLFSGTRAGITWSVGRLLKFQGKESICPHFSELVTEVKRIRTMLVECIRKR